MSEQLLIFDAMDQMRRAALRNGRQPRRWEINDAGIAALLCDHRVSALDMRGGLLDNPFFGIFMTNMPPGPKAYSEDPMVDLIVDEERSRS